MAPQIRNYANPPQSATRSTSSFQYLAFLVFAAIFVFKVDVLITQSISTARRSADSAPRQFLHPTFYGKTSSTTGFSNGTFNRNFVLTWGETRGKMLEGGELLTLSLDKASGSGFESKKEYIFAKIDMQIKLIPGNAAGTVTTYYLSSEGSNHDEIDFEFLGNSSGNPYTLHTNVFSQGKGEREQQFFLWFDPTKDFHTYSILWNSKCIVLSVDGQPIREFKNMESSMGVPYPKDQPMRIYSSLWNADDWATQHGRVKTNWSLAPFTASYRNFSSQACIWSYFTRKSSCDDSKDSGDNSWLTEELDNKARENMKLLQKKHMVYNYCQDNMRFPQGLAPECNPSSPAPPAAPRRETVIRKPRRGRRRGRSKRGNRG